MSRRARQLNRDVVETPLWSDNKVVNVASSMVTTPLINSGPCSGMGGASMHGPWAKSTSGVWWKSVSRECGRLGVSARVVRVETEMGDGVYFEDRIASVVLRDGGPRCGA